MKSRFFRTQCVISAVREQWKPKVWRDEYLELPLLQLAEQRWWNAAVSKWGYDVRNRLVADVFYCLWSGNECWSMPVVESDRWNGCRRHR
ncbi:hypothetical protein [Nostoc sp. MG11]|uniref:hypothetical protein n=1 Tax=Nostoc sp. MG11 TaxID=2721166 RepID=UPI001D034E8A|nr:hypothetical protein [Nostoc sp. MG11]